MDCSCRAILAIVLQRASQPDSERLSMDRNVKEGGCAKKVEPILVLITRLSCPALLLLRIQLHLLQLSTNTLRLQQPPSSSRGEGSQRLRHHLLSFLSLEVHNLVCNNRPGHAPPGSTHLHDLQKSEVVRTCTQENWVGHDRPHCHVCGRIQTRFIYHQQVLAEAPQHPNRQAASIVGNEMASLNYYEVLDVNGKTYFGLAGWLGFVVDILLPVN